MTSAHWALLVFFVLAVGLAAPASARDQLDRTQACLVVIDNADRLACFDREVRKLVPPRYSGRLSVVTERFRIDSPTMLRFQSDGAIFVLYLKTGVDEMVQNLHIGGGGESTYLIEAPGVYFLQVNGSESWRIWLEPQAPNAPTTN